MYRLGNLYVRLTFINQVLTTFNTFFVIVLLLHVIKCSSTGFKWIVILLLMFLQTAVQILLHSTWTRCQWKKKNQPGSNRESIAKHYSPCCIWTVIELALLRFSGGRFEVSPVIISSILYPGWFPDNKSHMFIYLSHSHTHTHEITLF